jgi:hypothetical protein
MSEFDTKLLEELTLRLMKKNGVNFEPGARYSVKCQFAQVENILRDAFSEMKEKITDDLQVSYNTDRYNGSGDGSHPLIDLDGAKRAVEQHLNPLGAEREVTKPGLGVDCVIWCAGDPRLDRLTTENHHEAYWAESLYAFGDEDKFLVLK